MCAVLLIQLGALYSVTVNCSTDTRAIAGRVFVLSSEAFRGQQHPAVATNLARMFKLDLIRGRAQAKGLVSKLFRCVVMRTGGSAAARVFINRCVAEDWRGGGPQDDVHFARHLHF